jgi:hypothetical protein
MRFINGENKTINVCVELINYTPISIDFLVDRMDEIVYWEAIGEEPVLWEKYKDCPHQNNQAYN